MEARNGATTKVSLEGYGAAFWLRWFSRRETKLIRYLTVLSSENTLIILRSTSSMAAVCHLGLPTFPCRASLSPKGRVERGVSRLVQASRKREIQNTKDDSRILGRFFNIITKKVLKQHCGKACHSDGILSTYNRGLAYT